MTSDASEHALRLQVKRELRTRMKAVRRALPKVARAARAEAIVERVAALEAFGAAEVVAVFVAVRGEVDLAGLVARARSAQKRIALPRVDPDRGEVTLCEVHGEDPLVTGAFGIPEPSPEAHPLPGEAIDLILVPALAVDPRGHRIGYGGGFYDRLLPTLPRAIRCAVAYDFQLLAEVPDVPGDARVHWVVTDRHTLAAEEGT